MLNSEDLEELKIQALANRSSITNPLHYFSDLTAALSSPSADHFIIKQTSNSNIFAFTYILLSHIFEARNPSSQHSSINSSSNLQTQSGSIYPEVPQSLYINSTKSKQREQINDPAARSRKLYGFLLSSKINFTQIMNLPQNLVLASRSCLKKTEAGQLNQYFKKLTLQFLQQLQFQREQKISLHTKNQQSLRKQSIVSKLFQKYPVCFSLFNIFIRCVLYSEYELTEALDYNKLVSDHTVYTALCDAFFYSSLHIEENHTEISSGNYIRSIRLKSKNMQRNGEKIYYWISTPQYKMEQSPTKEVLGCDTFRVRKKSSDVSSNNQSISFRQTSKSFYTQQQAIQNRNLNKSQNCISNPSPSNEEGEKTRQKVVPPQKSKVNPQSENSQNEGEIGKKSQAFVKTRSQNNMGENGSDKKLQKSLSDKMMFASSSKREEEKGKPVLNGYTSLEILKQLNPRVRESMLNTITYFKKYQPDTKF